MSAVETAGRVRELRHHREGPDLPAFSVASRGGLLRLIGQAFCPVAGQRSSLRPCPSPCLARGVLEVASRMEQLQLDEGFLGGCPAANLPNRSNPEHHTPAVLCSVVAADIEPVSAGPVTKERQRGGIRTDAAKGPCPSSSSYLPSAAIKLLSWVAARRCHWREVSLVENPRIRHGRPCQRSQLARVAWQISPFPT